MEPENALAILKALGGTEVNAEYIDLSVDETGNEVNPDQYEDRLPMAPVTTFSMLHIPIGSELNFTRNEAITCTVVDSRKVEYEGEILSLSKLTITLLKRDYNWKGNNVNGFQFWKYEDEILTDRKRAYLEKEAEELDF